MDADLKALLDSQRRIEEKLDKLMDIMAIQGLRPPWEGVPNLPGDCEPEEDALPCTSFDDLLVTRHIFPNSLAHCVNKWGEAVVRSALVRMQSRIATGSLKVLSHDTMGKILKDQCATCESEGNMARDLEVKQKALPIMLRQSGAAFQLGISRVQFSGDCYCINSKRADWLRDGDSYMVQLATKAAWQIRPLSDEATAAMTRFKMFAQTSQTGSRNGRGST